VPFFCVRTSAAVIRVTTFSFGVRYNFEWGYAVAITPVLSIAISGLGPVEIQDSQTVLFMIQASFWRRLE